MSANVAKVCQHCGVNAVPTQHRCAGKQSAIDKAREHYETLDRPVQVWDAEKRVWIHL